MPLRPTYIWDEKRGDWVSTDYREEILPSSEGVLELRKAFVPVLLIEMTC